ncbi:MAG: PVC-type heme-binding CxxCH protein [Planctomycetota bacterium]
MQPIQWMIATFVILSGSFCFAQDFQTGPDTQKLTIPMTPAEEALKMLHMPEGFHATLFAAEPDVHQPIAVTTDPKGRLWVAECYTYSDRKTNYDLSLNDRIVIFEDTDNDGVFDKRKIFFDQLKQLTGIEIGMGGVWVTASPNLLFIPDSDRDDIPDGQPQVILNGFENNVVRHNIVNGLRWGPDGWLYGRHGIQGYSFVGKPGATQSQRTPTNCCIWRYHPNHQKYEIVADGGTNPWGFDFDEHGEMFMINTVIGHLFHVVPNAKFKRMYGSHFNPHLYHYIDQTADHFHWDTSEETWFATKKDGMTDGTDRAGGGHAHTGLMIYQGGNWPSAFHNHLFTANFHGRRINCEHIHREGNSYTAHHDRDYFKSDDPWFRGIEMVYGPDGGVFLLDWSDIGECHENDGIHRTSGRIFKIVYEQPGKIESEDLTAESDETLVKLLTHPNEWYSRQSRQVLTDRVAFGDQDQTKSIVSLLEQNLAQQATAKNQLRLLWALYGCDQDSEQLVRSFAENGKSEHVRAWAIRLLCDGLKEPSRQTKELLIRLASDRSPLVRLYVASSISRLDVETGLQVVRRLILHAQDSADRVQPYLIWFGLEELISRVIESKVADVDPSTWSDLIRHSRMPFISESIARRWMHEIEEYPEVVECMVGEFEEWDVEKNDQVLSGMATALKGWGKAKPPRNWSSLIAKLERKEFNGVSKLGRDRIGEINLVFGDGMALEEVKKVAANRKLDFGVRSSAFETLGSSPNAAQYFSFFANHLNDKGLANSVIKALANCPQNEVGDLLLNRFPHFNPEGKSLTINALVSRSDWAEKLLIRVGKSEIDPNLLSAFHARQISNFEQEPLTKLLVQNWGEVRSTPKERQLKIETLETELIQQLKHGFDMANGKKLFEKKCASCHIMFGKGANVGPDLTGSDRRNLGYLLENIVDPNASVALPYRASTIVTMDGRLFTGVVIEENEKTLKLQTKDQVRIVAKSDVDERRLSNNSLMPEGILDTLSQDQVRDLIGFLKQ